MRMLVYEEQIISKFLYASLTLCQFLSRTENNAKNDPITIQKRSKNDQKTIQK